MKKKVYAYLHTHWDMEWYRCHEDFRLRLLKVFDVVLDELKNNRAPFFYFDGQIIALLDYLKYREEKKDLIIDLINRGKLAIGPYLVSADSYLISYHFMLKNLNYGLEISKKYGQKNFIGYMADIFGISNSAFLALREKNIKTAIIWRGVNPKKIDNNCNFIKNDVNTTWLAQGYFNDFIHQEADYKIKAENLKKYIEKIEKYSPNCLLLPVGADHLGCLKNANIQIKNINKFLDNYEIILTSPFEYFKKAQFLNVTKEKEFLDNSNTYILPGVYSARIEQKAKNVYLENKISKVLEPLNYYLDLNYQKNLDAASFELIKNHAHDGIYGCSIDEVQKTTDNRFYKVKLALGAIEKNIIGDFREKFDIKGEISDKLGVFNLGNKDIKTVKIKTSKKIKNAQFLSKNRGFEDDLLYDIYKIPVTENIKDIYTYLVQIDCAKSNSFNITKIVKPVKKTKISLSVLENDFIKFEIKEGGFYIIDKKNAKTSRFKITDINDDGDSYNFSPSGEYREFELYKTKIIANGDIKSTLRLYFKAPKIKIELDLSLDNYSKFIKFNSTIDNKKKNHKIQIVFMSDKDIKETVAQDAFGVIKRKTDPEYKMSDFMPAKKPYELKTNSYPMQSFVCANKISVLTKGLHEYEIYKNELRICLLRAFNTISNPKNKTRYVPAGPDLKTVDSQYLTKTNQKFAFLYGGQKECFNNLDEFFENYVTIIGEYKKEINLKLMDIPKNSYFYGLDGLKNNKKEVVYEFL